MAEDLAITLVANAGVLVEYDGVGLLVDGIHHEKGHPFSQVDETDLTRMRQGDYPFTQLDYLLFTHEHPDHCTPQRVLEHVRQRPVKGLFLPDASQGSPQLAGLLDYLRRQSIPHRTLGLAPGHTRHFTLNEDLRLTVIGTRHMGPQYQSVRNDCFLLSVKNTNLLFTGDADYIADYFTAALTDVPVDAVFVNPVFYHNKNGQEIINTIFRPRHIVIYHMPFAPDDAMHFAYMVQRDMEKHARPDIRTHVLLDRCKKRFALAAPTRADSAA